MKLFKYLSFVIIFSSIACSSMAQYEYPEESIKEEKVRRKPLRSDESKLFYSPRFGFSFWDTTGYLELAPIVGYKVTPRFWIGGGPEYLFLKSGSQTTSIYGITTFTYFAVLDNIDEITNLGIRSIFLYLENEILSIKPFGYDREWYDLLLGGVGVRMPIGDRMGISIIALWGLNRSTELLYSNPELRIMYDF